VEEVVVVITKMVVKVDLVEVLDKDLLYQQDLHPMELKDGLVV